MIIQDNVRMDEKAIKSIETILAKGDQAEVIPVKYGVVVKRIRKETVFEPPKQFKREDAVKK